MMGLIGVSSLSRCRFASREDRSALLRSSRISAVGSSVAGSYLFSESGCFSAFACGLTDLPFAVAYSFCRQGNARGRILLTFENTILPLTMVLLGAPSSSSLSDSSSSESEASMAPQPTYST